MTPLAGIWLATSLVTQLQFFEAKTCSLDVLRAYALTSQDAAADIASAAFAKCLKKWGVLAESMLREAEAKPGYRDLGAPGHDMMFGYQLNALRKVFIDNETTTVFDIRAAREPK